MVPPVAGAGTLITSLPTITILLSLMGDYTLSCHREMNENYYFCYTVFELTIRMEDFILLEELFIIIHVRIVILFFLNYYFMSEK